MTNADYRQGEIFTSGPSDEPHSYVGINRGENAFGLYAGGFFDAAEQLAQSMLQNRGKVDLNIYPLVYLYRHGTELALKQLCRFYGEISRGDPASETPPGHSLSTLWDGVKGNLEFSILSAGPSMDFPGPITIDEVDAIIADMDRLDPRGEVFRYPESLKGDHHSLGIDAINIRALHQVMSRLEPAFETWLYHIGEEASYCWHKRVVEPWIANKRDENK